jgi:hypothetical protein
LKKPMGQTSGTLHVSRADVRVQKVSHSSCVWSRRSILRAWWTSSMMASQ